MRTAHHQAATSALIRAADNATGALRWHDEDFAIDSIDSIDHAVAELRKARTYINKIQRLKQQAAA